MSRRPLIAGNWKLHLGPHDAAALAAELAEASASHEGVGIVIFPTALSIPASVAAVQGSMVDVGVQWAHAEPSGAFTGTNSAVIAREAGCAWLLAGHSEVRRDLNATDAAVHASVKAGLAAGLLPMVCIGETLDERDAGQLQPVLARQLAGAFGDLHADQVATCTLAYEPVWAIGTGRAATPDDAQQAHAFIRGWLREHYPAFVADQMRILYGGSVKPGNAAELLSCEDIDGALVGGASLKASSFLGIVSAVG